MPCYAYDADGFELPCCVAIDPQTGAARVAVHDENGLRIIDRMFGRAVEHLMVFKVPITFEKEKRTILQTNESDEPIIR
jgi:hypothetical protein